MDAATSGARTAMARRAARRHGVGQHATAPSSPRRPFGGPGDSGIGRESGLEAVREFTETKAVWVELTGATRDPFKLG